MLEGKRWPWRVDITIEVGCRSRPRISDPAARHVECNSFVDILGFLADVVTPLELPEASDRDVNDTPVLGTLLAGMSSHNVEYLVTGDKDLLALASQYPVLTPSEFWAKHGGF